MKKIPVLLLFGCIFLFGLSSLAYSAVDVVLHLDGIVGESVIGGHEGEIDALSWTWQMSAPSTVSGSVPGGAIIRPVIITKYVDQASPHLALALLNQNSIATGILTVRKAGESPVEYVRIKMWAVQVVNLSIVNDQGAERVYESVALAFSKVCYEYTPQEADGTLGAIIEKCWDIATNTEVTP